MLEFDRVSKSFLHRGRLRPVLIDVSFVTDPDENFGIVMPPRAGVTTLVNLIQGLEQPDAGRVRREGLVSWPIGGVSGLIPALSGAENCRYLAMIYGLDPEDVLAFAIDLARIGRYMDMPVKTYSSTLQKRLALSLLLALEFDLFLVVEGMSPGDPEFAERAGPLLRAKLSGAPVLYVAASTEKMRALCGRVAVLEDCRLIEFDSVEAAERHLREGAAVDG